jgi:hypothetical protein
VPALTPDARTPARRDDRTDDLRTRPGGPVQEIVLLAFTAALNPTLLTATTVMLVLPSPSRLMLGYWLGAMLTSITLGLVIVFTLSGSGAVKTTQRTLSPLADVALGAIALLLAYVVGTSRDASVTERRAKRKEGKAPPRWQQTLSRGTPRATFVIGALLTLPGASYLAGLTRLSRLDYSPAGNVATVVGFNLVMLILLEAPIVSFAVASDWTLQAIDRAKDWVGAHWRRYVTCGLAFIGAALLLKGVIQAL